ncbi:MAG: hypothetical protein RL376_1071, partial [Verrucomicrobiota bacterium]
MKRVFYLAILFTLGGSCAVADLPATFIKADGYYLRDQAGQGRILRLHGFNLGGWLFQEDWMSPNRINDPANPGSTKGVYQSELEATLVTRFGVTVKNQLIAGFQQAWINEQDLDNLAAHGVNLVRVPFSYLTLMEEDGTMKPDAEAFDRLDWIVTEAWERGIYCILDFHHAQGGQSNPLPGSLWATPLYQDRAVAIWQRVAARYAGNPAVAGYDLLNEPMGAGGTTQWNLVDRFYDAIRALDPDHVLFIEAVWDIHALPPTAQYGWSNVAYSFHWYPWNQDEPTMLATINGDVAKLDANTALGPAGGKVVPYNIGEFCFWDTPSAWRLGLSTFYQRGYSFTSWTFKTYNMGAWGLYNPYAPAPNLSEDTPEQIAAKWAAYATLSPTHAHNSYIRDLVAAPVATDDALSVPAGGTLVIPFATLLSNDSSLSAARSLTVTELSTPAQGTLAALDAQRLLYTPAPGYVGPVTFTYLPFDQTNGLGAPRPATVTLTITQPPASSVVPYAQPDAYAALNPAPLRVPAPGVLANDGDPSARPLSAELVSAPAPGQGTLLLRPDGSFLFTPAPGAYGEITFTYRPMAGGVPGGITPVTILVSAPPPSGPLGLTGGYSSSYSVGGSTTYRLDPQIDFLWGNGIAPEVTSAHAINSVQWNGWLTAPHSGDYTLTEISDDSAGVWINGLPIIEDWPAHGARARSATITLTAGQSVPIQFRVVNYGGTAVARLYWAHARIPYAPIPATWLTPQT